MNSVVDFDGPVAILTIYAEASSASSGERTAVAHVILNRMADRRWVGQSAAEVCTDYEQFSSFNGDKRSRANLQRAFRAPANDPVMTDCAVSWAAAKAWRDTDPTHGATHYHDKTIVPPSWANGATLTLETEKFRFYANVK